MRTQNAWIVAVAALGLGLGSFMTSSAAWTNTSGVPESTTASLEDALSQAPLVDCGEGREALLEPVVVDGRTSFKVRCVRTEDVTAEADAPREPNVQVVRVETAPVSVPETARADVPIQENVEVRRDPNADGDRTWKESAVVVGGAAGAGTVIGAIAKGKKGAAVGAAIGAASGAAYELMKKDRNRN